MILSRPRRTAFALSIAASLLAGSVLVASAATPASQIQAGLNSAATGAGYPTTAAATDLPTIIGSLISAALGLLGVLLLAYLLYGGFLWMTAAGDESKVKKARALITNAIIGLVIIVAAYSIANFVLGSLVNVTNGGTGTPTG